jgi:hypothetical protein
MPAVTSQLCKTASASVYVHIILLIDIAESLFAKFPPVGIGPLAEPPPEPIVHRASPQGVNPALIINSYFVLLGSPKNCFIDLKQLFLLSEIICMPYIRK